MLSLRQKLNKIEGGGWLYSSVEDGFRLFEVIEESKMNHLTRPLGWPMVVLPDFFFRDWRSFRLTCRETLSSRELQEELAEVDFEKSPTKKQKVVWHSPEESEFQSLLQWGNEQLESGRMQKWVPHLTFHSATVFGFNEFKEAAIQLLLSQSRDQRGTVFGWWGREEGLLGLSPERLFELRGNELRTHALAGTRWPEKEIIFETDEKEAREHEWVVRDLREKLSIFGPVSEGNREVVRYGTLEHLMTPFTVSCQKSLAVDEVIHRLHPTPALAGHPSKEVFSWMQTLPGQLQRGSFGAPLTFLLSEETVVSVVLIRTLFWDAEGMRLPVGCGIIQGADPHAEWQEIQQKFQSTLKRLGVFA